MADGGCKNRADPRSGSLLLSLEATDFIMHSLNSRSCAPGFALPAPYPRTAPELLEFADRSVDVICDSLGAEWGSFYYMNENGSPYGFRSPGIPRAFRDAYLQRGMEKDDPLHPRWLLPRQVHFLTMSEASSAGFGRVQRFQALLESFGAADAAEMIFRVDGNAVAGISLVWHSRSACAPGRKVDGLHSYVQYNLGFVWRSAVNQQLETSAQGISLDDLTSREREVVNAVCSGLSNAQISAQLGIRLATVKTHLVHVFDKLAVSSRGELISRMLERRPDSAGR